MAETQEIVTQENSAVLAELAKSFGETGGESTSTSSLARLRIERENIEDANGDIICPSGYFSVSTDDGKVFAKEVSFRYYEHRYRYKRYDAYAERTNKDGEKVQGAYIHSVLVKGPRDEAPSDDGDFQCGRPLEYIKDWKSLSKDRQEFLRSCRLMIIFYGEVTMKGVNEEGKKTEITIPVEIELSGKTSGKTLSKFFLDMVSKKRVLPNSRVVQMKSKKVSGGVTYYDIDVSVIDDTTYTMDDDTVALFSKFHDHIAQINKWIMEKHNSSNGSGEQDDDEDFIDINGSAA
jgi:hypothetical protein